MHHCYKCILLKSDRGDIPTVHLNKHMVKFRQLSDVLHSLCLITFEDIEYKRTWMVSLCNLCVCSNIHLQWALLKFSFSCALLDFTALFVAYPIPNIRYFSIQPGTSVVNVKMLCAYVCIYPHKCINKIIQKEFKVMLQKSSFVSFNKLQMHFNFSGVSWMTF